MITIAVLTDRGTEAARLTIFRRAMR
jgi:hypothetical protein